MMLNALAHLLNRQGDFSLDGVVNPKEKTNKEVIKLLSKWQIIYIAVLMLILRPHAHVHKQEMEKENI